MTEMVAKNEAVDMAEEIMNFKWAEAALRNALATGSRILQPSLMDFLR